MNNTLIGQRAMKPTGTIPYVIPSAISAIRVLLALLLLNNLDNWPEGILVAALIGVPIIFALDAVDGIAARYLNSQTLLGSFIDIAADRLVEFIFLQYFARAGLIPLWFVVVFYSRIVLTDACRMRAFGMDKVSASGILLPRPWHFLVLSKFSRSSYAAVKGILFSVLLLMVYQGDATLSLLGYSALFCVLAFSILRAVPILVNYLPRGKEFLGSNLKTSNRAKMGDIATRTTRVASWVQLASDICLALILMILTRN